LKTYQIAENVEKYLKRYQWDTLNVFVIWFSDS
jgi:hypothetical protein